jgi:PKD repeat protein
VECTVSDGYSSITKTQTVNSLSYAPEVSFHTNPGMGEYPLLVQFTESVSDRNGMNDIEIMSLDFGDGTPPVTLAQTQTISHVYSEPGTYTAQFIVRDADNHTVTRTNVLHVINTPPTADIRLTNPSPEYSQPGLLAGSTFRFDASGSNDTRTSDANLTFKYYWNNQLVTQGKGVTTFQYVPNVVGQYPVRVEVEDEKNATDLKTIQVYSFNRAPVVNSITRTPEGTIVYYLGSKVHFDIQASDPDQNTPLNLRIELDYMDNSGNMQHEVLYSGTNISSFEYELPNLIPKVGSVEKELNFRFIFTDDVSNVPGATNFHSRTTTRQVTVLVEYVGKSGGSF